jgi:hypothetical protein
VPSTPQPSTHAADDAAAPPPRDGDPSPHRLRSILDWFFRDRRSGRIVVAHFPNLALWLWIATIVLRRFVEAGTTAHELLEWAGLASLGWWSIDELVRGVNPWRRCLGLVGGTFVVAGILSQLGR